MSRVKQECKYRIVLEKDRFKFSVAHFTIFSRRKAERLHGHNYYVRASFGFQELSSDTGMGPDMGGLKRAIDRLCEKLDERVLIPQSSPYLTIEKSRLSVRVQMGAKSYEFPKEDVLLLPITNISCEALAEYFWASLKSSLRGLKGLGELTVEIRETTGQSASFSRGLDAV
jgi:6-pyruvoyltetrahydropterin/6-carboxytetrahydropterin synthase